MDRCDASSVEVTLINGPNALQKTKCYKCQKNGRARKTQTPPYRSQKVSTLKVHAFNRIDRGEAVTCLFTISGNEIDFLVDCEAELNVLPVDMYDKVTSG